MKRDKKILENKNGFRRFLFLSSFFFITIILPAQQINVRGKVTDTKGEPLIGVNVIVKGTNQGTVTDNEGMFSLQVPNENSVLEFSYVGFKTIEIQLNGRTSLNVTMNEDTEILEEVVVVGYGTQKKINLTGAVQNVSGEDLTKRKVSNTSIALQGLIPGVSVMTTSGRPGYDGANIKIRGTGSLNSSSNPLVIIDGVIADTNGMNYIDINAIESISVLKDAASASIYGSRASNGVILITTKRAKEEDKLNISYSGYVGSNTPTAIPKPVSAIEYMRAINIARANADMDPQYSEELINQYEELGADNFTRYDTNWRKEIIKDNALTHNNSLSISGGSKNIKLFGNLGYYYQDGNIANNDYYRATLKLNADARITNWLTAGLDINMRQSRTKQPTNDSPEAIINKATTFVPVFSGRNSDGTWGYGQNGDNPIASAEASGINTGTTPELGLKGFIKINPFEGFELLSSYSNNESTPKSPGIFLIAIRDERNG